MDEMHATHATCVDDEDTSPHLATAVTRDTSSSSFACSSSVFEASSLSFSSLSFPSDAASFGFGAHALVLPAIIPVAHSSFRPSSAGSQSFEVLLSHASRNARVAIVTRSALIAPDSAPSSASC